MRFPMSLRWSLYIALKPPKGGSKTQYGRFPSKITLHLKKVCYKVYLRENSQQQSCKAFIGLTNRAKMIGGDVPFYLNFGSNWLPWSEIANFRSIFARSTSALTPSEEVQCPLHAFQWAQDEHCTLSLSPQRGLKSAVSEIWTTSCD